MAQPDIKITNILGSQSITEDTPIIIITVPKSYLLRLRATHIYKLDYDKIIKINPSIKNYISVGQIYLDDADDIEHIKILMANTTLVPTTKTYQQTSKNIWIGVIKSKNRISRSLGTIISTTKPTDPIPVFPRDFLIRVSKENAEFHVYSHDSYGTWILNKHKFNNNANYNFMGFNMYTIDGKERIVDSDDEYNQKAFYTTQGGIMDPQHPQGIQEKDTVWGRKGKNIILKEVDEPWFLNPEIMGDVHLHEQPHKVTGLDTGASHLQVDEFTNRFTDEPEYGELNESHQNFKSDCVNVHDTSVKSYGHSRKDLYDKCYGIEGFSPSDDDCMNFNNVIMIIMCLIIIILLAYKAQ